MALRTRAGQDSFQPARGSKLEDVMAAMRELGSEDGRAGMARVRINVERALGVSVTLGPLGRPPVGIAFVPATAGS
ncbi:MAG: hypothetical protein M3O91_08375 [Chloroflexota bacterium]|nr:hypothetical protein [Chloroflexota bacterium]